MTRKTLQEQIADEDESGNRWLAKANEAEERGQTEKAAAYYEKGQRALDRLNKLLGNA